MVDIMRDTRFLKTPRHLWLVGVVAVLFNAIGVYDYVMSKTGGAAYMASVGMTPQQIAHYQDMPAWMSAVWAIGVFSAFAGGLLILLRNRLAGPAFALSLAAFLLSLVYTWGIAGAGEIMGQTMMISSAVITAMLVLLLWYSLAMGKRGVLR